MAGGAVCLELVEFSEWFEECNIEDMEQSAVIVNCRDCTVQCEVCTVKCAGVFAILAFITPLSLRPV